MERLIDANRLNEYKAWVEIKTDDGAVIYSGKRKIILADDVADAPTVDAEPVRHGHWIREPNCWYRCSECGSHYPSIADNMDYPYCPNCGAKMTLD